MENSEFDKYIRAQAQKNLVVPDGLSWEEMDIALPPQKRKRRIFLWFSLGLAMLAFTGGMTAYWLSTQSMTNPKAEKVIAAQPTEKLQEIVEANQSISSDESNIQQEEGTAFSPQVTSLNTTKNTAAKKPISSLSLRNKDEGVVLYLPKIIAHPNDSHSNALTQATEDKQQVNTQRSKLSFSTIQLLDITMLSVDKTLPKIIRPELPIQRDKKPQKNKTLKERPSLIVSFGLNRYKSNYSEGEQSAALLAAEDMAWGKSVEIGLKIPLKKHFFVTTGLAYQQLHTTITYSQYLGPEVNSVLGQITHRTRYINYNNYLDLLRLNVGVGKTLYFGQNWGSQLAFSATSSYQLNAKGRLLDDDLAIFEMEDLQASNRWLVGVDAAVNVFFAYKKNRFSAGVDINHNFSAVKLLESSDLLLRPQILTIKIGVERAF